MRKYCGKLFVGVSVLSAACFGDCFCMWGNLSNDQIQQIGQATRSTLQNFRNGQQTVEPGDALAISPLKTRIRNKIIAADFTMRAPFSGCRDNTVKSDGGYTIAEAKTLGDLASTLMNTVYRNIEAYLIEGTAINYGDIAAAAAAYRGAAKIKRDGTGNANAYGTQDIDALLWLNNAKKANAPGGLAGTDQLDTVGNINDYIAVFKNIGFQKANGYNVEQGTGSEEHAHQYTIVALEHFSLTLAHNKFRNNTDFATVTAQNAIDYNSAAEALVNICYP